MMLVPLEADYRRFTRARATEKQQYKDILSLISQLKGSGSLQINSHTLLIQPEQVI